MSLVTIEREKCTACGICMMRCPACFLKRNGEIIASAADDTCSLCGHCVALCPTNAITHHAMDMKNFHEVGAGVQFETDAFIQFIRQRRSHRHFRNEPIPKESLEKLIDTCRYAPTGGNFQDVEVVVVQDPEKVRKLSDRTIDFFIEMGTYAEKASEEATTGGVMMSDEQMQSLISYKRRLADARAAGFDPILYKAPAVMIFHADSQARTPKDDCVIAATTVSLTARTMGIESTYIGLLEMASRMSQSLNDELALPDGHQVYSVLVMGYPKLKFLRTVDRKVIRTRWE